MTMPFRDPAEDGHLRFFYRNWRTTRLARIHNSAFAWAAGLGLLPDILLTLQTKDRNSGRVFSTVLAPVVHEGERYVISMLGDGSQWVQNVRAAKGEAYIKRGSRRRVMLTELAPFECAAVLKAWCRVAPSGRRHLPIAWNAPLSAFEKIAGNYPVFRIDRAPDRPSPPASGT